MLSQSKPKSKLPLLIVGAILLLVIGIAIGAHHKTSPKQGFVVKPPNYQNGQKFSSF